MFSNHLKLFSASLNFFLAIFKQSLRLNLLNYNKINTPLKNLNFFWGVGEKNEKYFLYFCGTFWQEMTRQMSAARSLKPCY
jgi:hypothetical protein